ncbi:hypothetical protein QWJ34_04580 [Saccharibacillus sp. CPCC 101409]|uniref:hypothetical protein n=1 Tax=Saccharibacillus sp. CPCC 101409 TaxID=3058041 RepID=UPI0026714B22|nr:hypothetical protein [Saccharibacillus sp. CPCC 101409]MDO3409030.1 hypothetical protein [Saccharibacillus sp. CPCC 101409]
MKCPNCSSKDIGKIGSHQFYCWSCFIELTVNAGKMSVYQVEKDGTLSSLDDLFCMKEPAASISQLQATS